MTDNIIRLDYQQYRTVRRLVHECCNYQDGNCLLLDNGEECVCPQSISYSLVCKWFRAAVLPLDESVGLMLLSVSGAGLGCFLCGKAIPDSLGVPVDDDLPPQLFFLFQGRFDGLQLGRAVMHSGKGGGHSGVQFLRRGKAMLGVEVEGLRRLTPGTPSTITASGRRTSC